MGNGRRRQAFGRIYIQIRLPGEREEKTCKIQRAQHPGKPVSYTHLDVYKRQVLRVMSVKGGVGKIVEYGGEGVKNLTQECLLC